MPTLKEILLVPGNRPKVVADCVTLVQEEVDSKGGLSGLAIKGAYAVVKAVKPGFVTEALDHMLDDFVARLEPFWADAQAKNEPVGALMNARAGEVADALLAISDERAARAKNADREEGLREAAPDGQEARRGGGAAPRPADREVHQRRGVGGRAAARRAVGRCDARGSVAASARQLQPPMRVGATATSSYHICARRAVERLEAELEVRERSRWPSGSWWR